MTLARRRRIAGLDGLSRAASSRAGFDTRAARRDAAPLAAWRRELSRGEDREKQQDERARRRPVSGTRPPSVHPSAALRHHLPLEDWAARPPSGRSSASARRAAAPS